MNKIIEFKKVSVDVVEKLARFAHEGLPYMTGDENWFDYDKDWAVNVWWNWDTMQYRATAYRKREPERVGGCAVLDIEHGLDLF